MAPTRRHVQTDVTQQIKAGVEALVGIALCQQRRNEGAPLLLELRFEGITLSRNTLRRLAGKIQLLELGIELDKAPANPGIKLIGIEGHPLSTQGASGWVVSRLSLTHAELPIDVG